MAGIWAIAEKEFFDHMRSRKFLLIFGIFLVIAVVGMIGGVNDYQSQLDQYNDRQAGTSSSPLTGYMPEKPSIMSVFSNVATYLVFLGGILGIAMGFDLVTKEKESKSLKILLSLPIFRDEVINGKALGGIVALACALVIVLLVALATLLVYGIVPDGGELALIAAFGGVSFLLIFSYFGVALFMSTVSEDGGSALIYTIIIFVVLSVLVPTIADDAVMESIVGSQPELPQELLDQMQATVNETGSSEGFVVARISPGTGGNSEAWERFTERMQAYLERRRMVHDAVAVFSPSMNYETIGAAITSGSAAQNVMAYTATGATTTSSFSHSGRPTADPAGAVTGVAGNVIALILFPALFFGLAYIRFMRLDVR